MNTKKILIIFIAMFLVVSLSACFKKTEFETEDQLIIEGAAETGRIIDITGQNNQSAVAAPGDIIYVKLTGEADSGKQWNIVSPTSGDFLMLKDHKIVGLSDSEILNEEFTDEWWFKVEKTGTFNLQFDYALFGKDPEHFFKFEVISR